MENTADESPGGSQRVVYPRYPYLNSECLAQGIEDHEGCHSRFPGFNAERPRRREPARRLPNAVLLPVKPSGH